MTALLATEMSTFCDPIRADPPNMPRSLTWYWPRRNALWLER